MNWLNAELRRIGWSDSELARRCKVTPAAIYRVTKDGKQPSAKLARSIAAAFKPFTEISQSEVFRRAGILDDDGDGDLGIDSRLLYLFTRGWKRFPADLQRELEELVSTATEEEAEEIFRDAIRTWRERRDLADAASDDAPDSESPAPEKGAKKRTIQLQRRVAGA